MNKPHNDAVSDFNSETHDNTKLCVKCKHKALSGIKWPCRVCSHNMAHSGADDMWEGT